MTTDSGVAGAETIEAIAAAVLAGPAVAGLHGGRFNAVASYLPGRRVVGVAVTPSEITVGVVGRYPNTVAQIAAQVRAAVATVVPGVAVTEEVRRHVADRVGVLTGKSVVSMDVTVVSLPLPGAAPRVVR
jgi:hypothetical protein